jgi:branched-chain amino acid aminotransferase
VIALAGDSLREEPMDPGALYAADEVFITSTLREVLPIVNVDGRAIGAGLAGPVTQALTAALRACITNELR